jgi:hypothetical protein
MPLPFHGRLELNRPVALLLARPLFSVWTAKSLFLDGRLELSL